MEVRPLACLLLLVSVGWLPLSRGAHLGSEEYSRGNSKKHKAHVSAHSGRESNAIGAEGREFSGLVSHRIAGREFAKVLKHHRRYPGGPPHFEVKTIEIPDDGLDGDLEDEEEGDDSDCDACEEGDGSADDAECAPRSRPSLKKMLGKKAKKKTKKTIKKKKKKKKSSEKRRTSDKDDDGTSQVHGIQEGTEQALLDSSETTSVASVYVRCISTVSEAEELTEMLDDPTSALSALQLSSTIKDALVNVPADKNACVCINGAGLGMMTKYVLGAILSQGACEGSPPTTGMTGPSRLSPSLQELPKHALKDQKVDLAEVGSLVLSVSFE